MSRCFTWFTIGVYRRTQYITSIGLFYKKVGRLWRVYDCEELVVPSEEVSRHKCV